MDDAQYRIVITSVAERSGADAERARLEKMAGAAKVAGKDVTELEQKIARAKQAIQEFDAQNPARPVEDLGRANEEASGKVEKHALSHRNLHKIIHALNGVLPGFGYLIQAAFSPIGATIGIAVAALHAFHERMKEFNEDMKKAAEEAAKPLTHRLEAQKEAAIELGVKLEGMREKLDEAARAELTLKEQTTRAIEELKKQSSNAETVFDAMGKAQTHFDDLISKHESNRLEDLHKRGLISEEQFASAKLDIEERLAMRKLETEKRLQQDKLRLQEQAENAELEIRRQKMEEAKTKLPDQRAKLTEAIGKAGIASMAVKAMPTEEEINDRIKRAKDELEAFESISIAQQIIAVPEHSFAGVKTRLAELGGAVERARTEGRNFREERTRKLVDQERANRELEIQQKKTEETEAAAGPGARRDFERDAAILRKQQQARQDALTLENQGKTAEAIAGTRAGQRAIDFMGPGGLKMAEENPAEFNRNLGNIAGAFERQRQMFQAYHNAVMAGLGRVNEQVGRLQSQVDNSANRHQ